MLPPSVWFCRTWGRRSDREQQDMLLRQFFVSGNRKRLEPQSTLNTQKRTENRIAHRPGPKAQQPFACSAVPSSHRSGRGHRNQGNCNVN